MKGLATIWVILVLGAVPLLAGPLEFYLGAGPSAATLSEINAIVTRWNTVIQFLNTTFSILPNVNGEVAEIPRMGRGIAYQAGERYWFSDQLAVGGRMEYFRTNTSTAGTYLSSETSEIAVALDCYLVSVLLGGRYTFLDAGVRLTADLGVSYTYAGFSRSVTFEVPPEYPDEISGLPSEGEGRYGGTAFGWETAVAFSLPITEWLGVEASLAYRSTALAAMQTASGLGLDLDADGITETIGLSGITVQFTLSIKLDLSPVGEKE